MILCLTIMVSCGHIHTEEIIPACEATCSKAGLTEGIKCSQCGEILVAQQEIEQKAHTEEIIPAVDPSCTRPGNTKGVKCLVCGETLIEAHEIPILDHIYDDGYDETCNVCGQVRDALCPHTDTEVIKGMDSTCCELGYTDGQKCLKCGEILVEQEVIYYKDHTPSDWIVQEPTVLENGKYYIECILCGEIISEQMLSRIETVGLEYEINDDNNSYSVVGLGSAYGAVISIPSVHRGLPVTRIGNGAFSNKSWIKSVVIPDSITTIGSNAFKDCIDLTSVNFLPNSQLSSIGDYAFSNCISLTSITIPDSVTEIWHFTFAYCSALTSIDFGENSQLKRIGRCAFHDCDSLTNFVIPNTVDQIEYNAFSYCDSLINVKIGEYLRSLDNQAFIGCVSLTSIEVNDNNMYYKSIDGNLYKKDVKTLIQYAIGKKEKSFTIPNSVTSIGNSAFSDCDSLIGVVIPNSVTSIGNSAFYHCESLTSITIPESVVSIGDSAFRYCESLTSITIPESVVSIGDSTFYYCRSLTSITIPESVTSIGESAFAKCDSLTSVVIPKSVTSIGVYAFKDCKLLTIYCEATTEPSEWGDVWNSSNIPVVWGYKGE